MKLTIEVEIPYYAVRHLNRGNVLDITLQGVGTDKAYVYFDVLTIRKAFRTAAWPASTILELG